MSDEVIKKLSIIRQRVCNVLASAYYRHGFDMDDPLSELDRRLTSGIGYGVTDIQPVLLDELQTLPREVLYDFGFGNWDQDLILFPLWIVPFVWENPRVISIMGDVSTLDECDKDVRGGCIAWGFLHYI